MRTIFLAVLWLAASSLQAQEKSFKVTAVGFYNFENYFDTERDTSIRDAEFTPDGDKAYTPAIFEEKTGNLAKVVSELATDVTPDGVAILGVSEVENRAVLEHFVQHPKIRDRNYQIVHYDSPDERGIDVALLYQEKYFTVTHSKAYPLTLYREDSTRDYTRDILLVSGLLDGEPLHVLVNHWPSRSGGEAASRPGRNAAAFKCKLIADSIMQADPQAKVIIMGDLNDDPISPSVKDIIRARPKKKKVDEGGFFNPMFAYYKKGFGTLAYRDAWSLFDQIILSQQLIDGNTRHWQFYKAVIHNPPYMVQKTGRFKGYPFRTFSWDTYQGGYSDHFPVYVLLVKEY